jgi:branched-chain amino acid transport system permease protein
VTTLIQQLLNGLIQGSLYVIVALGLTLIYGVLVQINFAHGEFLMLGAFAGLVGVDRMDLPYAMSVVMATVVGGLMGVVIEFAIFRPLRKKKTDALRPLVATVGVSILLQNLALLYFGPNPKQYASPYTQPTIEVFGLYLSYQRAIIFVVSVSAIVALFVFLRTTATGRAMRAVSQDAPAASLMGVNVSKIILMTFIIGSALAGLGGSLLGPLLVVEPLVGANIIVLAFAIVIIGGFGNVNGTIIAGLLVGVIESLVTGYLEAGLSSLIIFSILLLTLAVRPTGLIAERVDENV